MRELKFRTWDKRKRIMVYRNENESADYWDGVYASEVQLINALLDSPLYEFMQYTGLKDRNGREIYEGDIVRIWGGEYCQGYWEVDEIGEVVFEEYSFGTKSNGRFHPFNIAFEPYDLEIKVIGNIFEHHHLLEAKGNESRKTFQTTS